MTKTLDALYTVHATPWRFCSDHLLGLILRTQAAAAKRNLNPVWFWRYSKEKSGSTPVYRETGQLKKVYDAPVPAFLFIKAPNIKKDLTKPMVDEQAEAGISIDLAECIRLGEIYKVMDSALDFHFYMPASGDVYQWNFSLFEIEETKPLQFFEPVQRFIVWEGQAKLLRSDSTDPNRPIKVLPSDPKIEAPQWVR
jgi:hypothetical protein